AVGRGFPVERPISSREGVSAIEAGECPGPGLGDREVAVGDVAVVARNEMLPGLAAFGDPPAADGVGDDQVAGDDRITQDHDWDRLRSVHRDSIDSPLCFGAAELDGMGQVELVPAGRYGPTIVNLDQPATGSGRRTAASTIDEVRQVGIPLPEQAAGGLASG